jgi:DNA-binding transcriptional ArsR family regulator
LFFRPSSKTAPAPRRSVAAKPVIGDGSSPVDGRFESECATFFSEVVQVFGVPKSVGQIYGLLYASPEPLSFSDIVERLEISKGSASQGLQLLRSLGAIKVADAKREAQSGKSEEQSAKRQAYPSPLPLSPLPLAGDARPPHRVAYEPELSLRRLVSGVMQERISPLAVAGTDRLGRLRELAESDGGANGFYLDRVKQLETWRRRLRTVLPMLSMLLGPMRAAKSKEQRAKGEAP